MTVTAVCGRERKKARIMQKAGTAERLSPRQRDLLVLYSLDCLGRRDTGATGGSPLTRRLVGARLAIVNHTDTVFNERQYLKSRSSTPYDRSMFLVWGCSLPEA